MHFKRPNGLSSYPTMRIFREANFHFSVILAVVPLSFFHDSKKFRWIFPSIITCLQKKQQRHSCRVSVYPQKLALSILDLMVIWFSLLDLVTKLASPFCRRLLCSPFCCLVSCLRTFCRTTSCKHTTPDSTLLQMNGSTVCLSKAVTTICYFCYKTPVTFFHKLGHQMKALWQHLQAIP